MKKTKIGIVGGGFGGISACKSLSSIKDVEIELIDRRNHHLFQPLLYQVAMAGLNPADIAIPIRKLFSRKNNVMVTMAEVKDVDVKRARLHFDGAWHHYDYLILACGSKHSYFGNNAWEPLAPGLKNIEQATEIRRRILTAFEMAEKTEDESLKESYLTFSVIGGGPTGVELAGAIAEMARQTLRDDYKRADLCKTRVILVEAGPRVLSAFPGKLSKAAQESLAKMGVEVHTAEMASDLSPEGLKVGDDWINCKTIIWAAGVVPSSLSQKVESDKDKQGRIVVENDCSLKANSKVFAIGDSVYLQDEKGQALPGLAPVAIQQGQFVGKAIGQDLKNKERGEFRYWDKGMMATIGRSKAVVSAGRFQFAGFFAWLVWVVIHILYLMRFRNKVFVFLQWVWSYFKFGRGARLIVHKNWRFYSGKSIKYDNSSTSATPSELNDF